MYNVCMIITLLKYLWLHIWNVFWGAGSDKGEKNVFG
jgi:hypothetical protein